MLLAHSQNAMGQAQGLSAHLQAVADTARGFAAKWGTPELGYWAGLWHDAGKASPAFQQYLSSPRLARRGPDHKGAGAVLAMKHLQPLAFLVKGHHGGLPSKPELLAWLTAKQAAPEIQQTLRNLPVQLPEVVPKHPLQPSLFARTPSEVEFLLRMVYSTLVDADRLDTEAHFSGPGGRQVGSPLSIQALWERFEQNQAALRVGPPTPVNEVRSEIYDSCLQAGGLPPGFFRLTVPTGGGKTRSGMAFALRHALAHGLDRIIVAIPYTSIVEQTAREYRQIFGPDSVLEHHSAVREPGDPDAPTPAERWAQLAAENWDAPVVVTTTVQLFESLHASGSSPCRKLHNIARSVVILDEVQTLPPELLDPIAAALRELVTHYGTTVVFCTATQPALEQGPFRVLPPARELVPDPQRFFQRLRRVEYRIPPAGDSWTWDQIARMIRQEAQSLTVVNTKRDAMALLDALNDPDALHLSTQMCGAHRMAVLDEARRRLAAGAPCRLVSTQVIEAGVDIDFPVVLRAIGPLDRIVQAAGRCNREGKRASGTCIVFRPAEGHLPPGSYRTATAECEQLLANSTLELHDPGVFDRYFQRWYQGVHSDRHGIMALRTAFDYPGTAAAFRMIPDDTAPVVVKYPPEQETVEELLQMIRTNPGQRTRHLLRRLQPYMVNVPVRLLHQYEAQGLAIPLLPGLWEWHSEYDPQCGLRATQIDPADLIW